MAWPQVMLENRTRLAIPSKRPSSAAAIAGFPQIARVFSGSARVFPGSARTKPKLGSPARQGFWDIRRSLAMLSKRRGWDSNPRKVSLQTISSRSLSTTQPPLHGFHGRSPADAQPRKRGEPWPPEMRKSLRGTRLGFTSCTLPNLPNPRTLCLHRPSTRAPRTRPRPLNTDH
ncbi:MAG: hypothetical protein RLZZ117_216 [Cyanobacteriota bacterium]